LFFVSHLVDITFPSGWKDVIYSISLIFRDCSHEALLVSPRVFMQERSRGGQEVPQGVRSGAQGSVVHRLPLEKGLPALPRLNAAV